MKQNQLFTNRTIENDQMNSRLQENRITWYTPMHYLDSFKSVVKSEYWDTTSSSGDWNGWFVQKFNNRYFLIRFSQENRAWYGGGYTLYTGNVLAEWSDEMLSDESIYEILADNDRLYS